MTEPDPLALAAVVAYCGWDPTVFVTDRTVLVDGGGTGFIALPCMNVTDVSAVVVTDWQGDAYTAVLTGEADVSWSPNGIVEWLTGRYGYGWPQGRRNVAVTYSGGYNGPPDDLLAAVNHLSGRVGAFGTTSRRLGSAAVNYGKLIESGGLLAIEQMVLDKYRIPRAA